MPAGRLHTLALGALAAAGCQDAAPAPAPAEPVIALRGADGAVRLEARLRGATCALSGETTLEVTRTPDGAKGGELTLGPSRTPGDLQIAGADGAPQLRIHRAETRISVLGADDVPLARIDLAAHGAVIMDAARAPVATLAHDGGGITVTAPDGARLANLSGTSDLAVAALLAAPGVPADARGLLACERLLTKQ